MKMPGVIRPCNSLQNARTERLVAVAVSEVQIASNTMELTIIRLRLTRSARTASSAAEKATPKVEALMVRLTLPSEAWNTRESSGSSGWVQERSMKANIPHTIGANTWL